MSEKPNSAKLKIDPAIIAAIIGAIGTIVVAIISMRPGGAPSPAEPTQTPFVVTANTETLAPTSTLETGAPPESPTPVVDLSTSTVVFSPTLAAGEDWDQDCISTAWQVSPATEVGVNAGCYVNLFNSVFSADNGRLTIFVDTRVNSPEISGLFLEVPSNSIVSVGIHLDELQTGEMWAGIFSQADIESNGFVVAVLPGSARNSGFAALNMPTGVNLFSTGKFPKDSGDYSVALDVTPNTVFGLIEQYTRTASFSLPSEKKWLFLGYRALLSGRNRVEGNFFDLEITPR